eukprot:3078156-Rhodomonas_salina.1
MSARATDLCLRLALLVSHARWTPRCFPSPLSPSLPHKTTKHKCTCKSMDGTSNACNGHATAPIGAAAAAAAPRPGASSSPSSACPAATPRSQTRRAHHTRAGSARLRARASRGEGAKKRLQLWCASRAVLAGFEFGSGRTAVHFGAGLGGSFGRNA